MSTPRRINIGALLVAAAGVFVIFLSAPDLFPAVPPGVIILAVAAALVAFVPSSTAKRTRERSSAPSSSTPR